MNLNWLKNHFQENRLINYLQQISKIGLLISSAALLLSIVLWVVYGVKAWIAGGLSAAIIWYTIFVALFAIFFSLVTIVVCISYYHLKQQEFWLQVKKQVFSLITTIILFIVLIVVIRLINRDM